MMDKRDFISGLNGYFRLLILKNFDYIKGWEPENVMYLIWVKTVGRGSEIFGYDYCIHIMRKQFLVSIWTLGFLDGI
jgi:hypothetical protein